MTEQGEWRILTKRDQAIIAKVQELGGEFFFPPITKEFIAQTLGKAWRRIPLVDQDRVVDAIFNIANVYWLNGYYDRDEEIEKENAETNNFNSNNSEPLNTNQPIEEKPNG